MLDKTSKIWINGNLVDWDDAEIHVLTHALHYGTAVFEGLVPTRLSGVQRSSDFMTMSGGS